MGADFCDRDDVQRMLNESNSDAVKCIYNPGPSKRIRLSSACQSSLPSQVLVDVFEFIYGKDEAPAGYEVYPSYVGRFPSGAYWIVEQNQALRVPVIRSASDHQQAFHLKVSSVLFCRVLWPHGECRDTPLRGASRMAKMFIDGIEVRLQPNFCFITSFLPAGGLGITF